MRSQRGYLPNECFKRSPTQIFAILSLSLFSFVLFDAQPAHAYSISYGYLLGSSLEENHLKSSQHSSPSQHQLIITDGYCMFIHQGPFDRICFEGGPGFRMAPFAFDLHFQTTLHAIWLRPFIYGLFLQGGVFTTLHPFFRGGVRFAVGFHVYFIAPSIELQVSVNESGRGDAKVFFQLTLQIPTASINFAMGNFGL